MTPPTPAPDATALGRAEVRTMAAISDVILERQRQRNKEGWTESHDDGHYSGELARAAACYAMHDVGKSLRRPTWPWTRGWWKPKDQRRNLVRAAALLIAEIERLDRRQR